MAEKKILKKIVIPNVECVDDEHYDQMIDILNSMPVNYEIWSTEEIEE